MELTYRGGRYYQTTQPAIREFAFQAHGESSCTYRLATYQLKPQHSSVAKASKSVSLTLTYRGVPYNRTIQPAVGETFAISSERQHLFPSATQKKSTLRSTFTAGCSILGRSLLAFFAPSYGPRVTKILRDGKAHWKVYDPHTEATLSFNGEKDTHIWLDQQRYRQ